METSSRKFHEHPDTYLHHGEMLFDSGIGLSFPIQVYMIPLDIFLKSFYNNGIRNKLEAWLAFLTLEQPEDLCTLLSMYPEFQPLYQHLYDLCQNVEGMMNMFSKELQIMDRNTVKLMVDEMTENAKKDAETIRTLSLEKEVLSQRAEALSQRHEALSQQNKTLIAEVEKLHAIIRDLESRS